MNYSIISLLALILNIIINRGAYKTVRIRAGKLEAELRASVRYSHFLLLANSYFTVDVLWGILYEYRDIDALFPFLYIDCILYFLFMFLTML
nr:hypothetical protein [Lachnospiraceae bacterium]